MHGRRDGARRLSEMEAGTKGRIAHVCCRGHIGKRLLEMGLTRGTPIEVVRHAPLGDPVEIRIRGYLLSLRKSEAEHIEVEL
jgi:ferrous iron transport protein A